MEQSPFTSLMNIFTSIIPWTAEEIGAFTAQLTVRRYKKGEYLLQPPELCDHMFFINSGFCMVYRKDSQEKISISHFTGQLEAITDISGFLVDKPTITSLFIKILLPTEAILIPKTALSWIHEYIPLGDKLGRMMFTKYATEKMQDLCDSYIINPLDRYERMLTKFPDIEQKVSQKIVAAYLNITPQYLSLIKSKRIKYPQK